VFFGTRPEAIKMAPLILAMRDYQDQIDLKICATAQHRQMLDHVLNFFSIQPDYDLNLMQPNQSLFDSTGKGLITLEPVIDDVQPDLILIQGDTTTAFIGALAGFYKRIKVAHIEAGLRSGDKYAPFPEEVNRIFADYLADFHFAPTQKAMENLLRENIRENIFVVGNTVIDALFLASKTIKEDEQKYFDFFNYVDFSKRILLVTGHRRENFGQPFENICCALKTITEQNGDLEIVYPVHLNPNVREPINRFLKNTERIHCIEPLSYPHLIFLMHKSYMILTDSGGIQEEASSLGKPLLVMRNKTERVEAIEAGCAKLVGTDCRNILGNAELLLNGREEYDRMSHPRNLYGDGNASQRIIRTILNSI
jgi:UDP-N-acetylglucosamine 2-epimerase (non-hydrolysing)